jgi:hypothetical protein
MGDFMDDLLKGLATLGLGILSVWFTLTIGIVVVELMLKYAIFIWRFMPTF